MWGTRAPCVPHVVGAYDQPIRDELFVCFSISVNKNVFSYLSVNNVVVKSAVANHSMKYKPTQALAQSMMFRWLAAFHMHYIDMYCIASTCASSSSVHSQLNIVVFCLTHDTLLNELVEQNVTLCVSQRRIEGAV
jgi:hypothetical protein